MKNNTFSNPLLSGFYPDPSICRVGSDYYMVTSSFVYFPGLPIFHSKDLVHWEQIGHGISDPEQLDYKNCETSLGLWAPTIRYHEGTFYIINTFVSEGREARRDNYIITAKNPAGPWSRAHFIKNADGIDSSLYFDQDGRIRYMGNYIHKRPLYEGHHGIYLCELNPETLQFKGRHKVIWNGAKTGSKWIEAPHIYYHDGYYYLIVAEGGTFTNHSVMMARCKTIDGDYEICPRNPVVSHRHLSLEHEISVTGHADLVQTQNNEWWMVLPAVRPYEGAHFNLGRETFMVPVIWDSDGWLRVDNDNGLVNSRERLPELPFYHTRPAFCSDNFESDKLNLCWNSIHPYSDDQKLKRSSWTRLSKNGMPNSVYSKVPTSRKNPYIIPMTFAVLPMLGISLSGCPSAWYSCTESSSCTNRSIINTTPRPPTYCRKPL
ncbi:MAG: glycoside hydrolase family 43 protein [Lachnospiraceae bacterium]|nr:glycoside hydrolase family 43 protein [Lachnospiraceae bacterium]